VKTVFHMAQRETTDTPFSSIAYFYCLIDIRMNDWYIAFQLCLIKSSLKQKFYLQNKLIYSEINNNILK